MEVIIFIIFIIVIIIFIHYLSKNIDNFSNYDITKLNTPDSDLNIYSENINFLSNNNTINSDLLCINGECIDFAEERNKTLPKPSGEDGVCTDDQCYECTCENGKEAELSCTKKKSESDREQCETCDPGHGLVNGKCVECINNTYNDRQNNNECQSCSDLKCDSPYYKRTNCGGSSKGMCSRKTCKCEENGTATWSCTTETENTCAQCNKGHKLTADAGTVGARCVACEANTYQSTINQTTSCINCPTCPPGQYRKGCGGISAGSCVNCPSCTKGKYRKDCGGTSPGTCANCPSCYMGWFKRYRKGCGGTSSGDCANCPSCPSGQYRKNCGGSSEGDCVQNVCTCKNNHNQNIGTAATGQNCTFDGGNICASCNGGYYKSGSTCLPCTRCAAGQYETGGCHTNNNRTCEWKQCSCTDGTGAHGTNCPHHGHHKCVNCKSNNYSLRHGRCTFNQIYMFKDSNYRGENRWIGGENNTCQNLRDLKYNYSIGSKMDNNMSSFKKDPNARVTLFYKRGCGGECYDLTGHGDKHNVGSWWNDDVAAVGYGMPCHNHRGW